MIWLWFWFDMLIMFPLYLDYQYETLTSLVTGVLWPCLLMPPTAWLEVGRVMSQPVPSVIIICMHTIIYETYYLFRGVWMHPRSVICYVCAIILSVIWVRGFVLHHFWELITPLQVHEGYIWRRHTMYT